MGDTWTPPEAAPAGEVVAERVRVRGPRQHRRRCNNSHHHTCTGDNSIKRGEVAGRRHPWEPPALRGVMRCTTACRAASRRLRGTQSYLLASSSNLRLSAMSCGGSTNTSDFVALTSGSGVYSYTLHATRIGSTSRSKPRPGPR